MSDDANGGTLHMLTSWRRLPASSPLPLVDPSPTVKSALIGAPILALPVVDGVAVPGELSLRVRPRRDGAAGERNPVHAAGKFRGWWALTEACSGHTGDFDAIHWYVLPPGDSTFQLEGQTVGAAWYGEGNKIVFAAGQQIFPTLVRHEMLHALIRVPGHPRDQFLDQCGDIVDCLGPCISDAGGPPAFSDTAPIVDPTALRVTTLLAPNPVTLSADSGWFPLTVMVSNGMPHAVRVPIPFPNNGDSAGSSFQYLIVPTGGGQSKWGGYTQLDGTDLDFAPAGTAGATRRLVFDSYPTLLGLAPGDYDVRGIFLGPTSAPTVLHALP